jgi:carboxymethylenebutenolidase
MPSEVASGSMIVGRRSGPAGAVRRAARRAVRVVLVAVAAAACGPGARAVGADGRPEPGTAGAAALPAGAPEARARLAASPRHGEWALVPAGGGDSVRAWVVYPERADRAPVVLVVHEIFGLTNWIRAVADQLAADGFIAIAPDLLTGRGVPQGGEGEPEAEAARAAIRDVPPDEVHRRLRALAAYGMALPAAQPRYGVLGFCWGGTVAFEHAVRVPELGTAVVFYGSSPATASLAAVRAPVLGLYGGDDARVNATIPPAEAALRAAGRTFEAHVFPGAGHGFLRAQDGRDANLRATEAAWPLAVRWLRRQLEPGG